MYYVMIWCDDIGNFRQDSCEYSPSSSPDVINVGAIQEAEDPDSSTPGKVNIARNCM